MTDRVVAAFDRMGGQPLGDEGTMAIKIWRRGEHYDVLVVADAEDGARYRSAEPLTALEVVTCLEQLGCHPADVGQAMSAADPGWMARVNASAVAAESPLVAVLAGVQTR